MTYTINAMPSLYFEAGAIQGGVPRQEGTPVCYSEDASRHNAVDKIRQVGLTLVRRSRGKRLIAWSGEVRISYDQDQECVEDESARHRSAQGRRS